jgi:hypothetical protein
MSSHAYKASHGSGQSSVGNSSLYEAGDQRNEPQSVINERERYKEGVKGSHKNLDSKDERSIANRLASQGNKPDSSHHHNSVSNPEAEMSKQDPTKPVRTNIRSFMYVQGADVANMYSAAL